MQMYKNKKIPNTPDSDLGFGKFSDFAFLGCQFVSNFDIRI